MIRTAQLVVAPDRERNAPETDEQYQARLEEDRKVPLVGDRKLRQSVALLRAHGKPPSGYKEGGKAAARLRRQQDRLALKKARQHTETETSQGKDRAALSTGREATTTT